MMLAFDFALLIEKFLLIVGVIMGSLVIGVLRGHCKWKEVKGLYTWWFISSHPPCKSLVEDGKG